MSFNFSEDLIPFKIRKTYFEEYLGLTPLTVFMGTSPEDAIQVFESQNGEGLSYRVAFRKDLNYENPIIGFDQAAGSEQHVQLFHDEIRISLLRFVDVLMGVTLVQKATPLDIFGALRPLLLRVQQRNLVASLLKAGHDLYPSPSTQVPSIDRCLFAGGGDHPLSIHAGVEAMGGADYKHSGLSVNHLRKLKTYAITGGVALENEARIKPIQLKTKKGFPEELYIYLMDSNSYTQLS